MSQIPTPALIPAPNTTGDLVNSGGLSYLGNALLPRLPRRSACRHRIQTRPQHHPHAATASKHGHNIIRTSPPHPNMATTSTSASHGSFYQRSPLNIVQHQRSFPHCAFSLPLVYYPHSL